MSLNDPLANAVSHLNNCEKKGKTECFIKGKSKIIIKILDVLKNNKYIGSSEEVSSARGGILKVNLIGNINKCGVVKPRFSFTEHNFETFEKRYLPARGFGLFIVTTSQGIMTHREALEKRIGGKLLIYCY